LLLGIPAAEDHHHITHLRRGGIALDATSQPWGSMWLPIWQFT
jgi:hypothetical protein